MRTTGIEKALKPQEWMKSPQEKTEGLSPDDLRYLMAGLRREVVGGGWRSHSGRGRVNWEIGGKS